MKLLDYECQTTFWEDFSIAEAFGEEAVRDTYKRAEAEWKHDRIYGTASFMLNFGKNTMIGCLRIGRVKIWSII